MTGCGSTEGIDNSLGCGPQGRAGRHSAVLTLHSHITECLALSPAFLHNPRPRTTIPPTPAHLHSTMTSLLDLLPSLSPPSAFYLSFHSIFLRVIPLHTIIFLPNGARLTTVHCPVNPLTLFCTPQGAHTLTQAPLNLLALTYKSCSLHIH